MTGLPTIVSLSMLCGILVTSNIASLMHAAELRQQSAIAESNLVQAERKWMACHESGVYTVGSDIYLSKVKRSHIPASIVPEVNAL